LAAVRSKSPPGRSPKLPAEQHEAFKQRVLAGPTEADDVCALRGREIIDILAAEFGVRYKLSGVYDLLHRLNLSVLAPRPQHRKSDPQAMEAWVESAPFLSKNKSNNTPARTSPSGSRMKRESASKAR
jgi:transposase